MNNIESVFLVIFLMFAVPFVLIRGSIWGWWGENMQAFFGSRDTPANETHGHMDVSKSEKEG